MRLRKIGKQAKSDFGIFHIAVIAIILQAAGIVDFKEILGGGAPAPDGDGDGGQVDFGACPTDGDTDLKLNVRNEVNTTGTEEFDVTAYIYDSSGALVATVTDTTSPGDSEDVRVNCGDNYVGKVVAADANNGDNSKITGVDYGAAEVAADGSFSFAAEKSVLDIGLRGRQHGTLQFKSYDNNNAGFQFDDQDASATDYEADGVTFNSTTAGTSATAIGVGGILDVTLHVQGTGTDTDFQDQYVLLLVEGGASALTIWSDPSLVTWNGVALQEVSAQLTPEEAKQFSAYEWVYRIDGPIEDVVNRLNFQIQPAAGQNPTADMELDFAAAGNYLSTDGKTVKTGAARDDTSYTVTYTIQDVTYDLS